METVDIKVQFEEILEQVKQIQGMSDESATKVATVILTEAGKDRRAHVLSLEKSRVRSTNRASSHPATFKQKNALKRLGITYSEDISKAEASELIGSALAKSINEYSE